ncbi:hypothetical protein [Cyclobacterium sp.]|uniref:hypothetical protein n=1 Tax=Cyclobacterium sp. TaxID=1966343 RepID=UPI001982773D|nr:hypothetical protein [Cyclobacterium sp.]MBD3630619.1 hypothetical protein [Cyclobacterium sp.]
MGKSSLFFLFLFALATIAFPQEKKGFDLSRVSIPLDEIKDVFQGQMLSISFDAESQSAEIRDAGKNIIPTVMNFWFAYHPKTSVYVHKD